VSLITRDIYAPVGADGAIDVSAINRRRSLSMGCARPEVLGDGEEEDSERDEEERACAVHVRPPRGDGDGQRYSALMRPQLVDIAGTGASDQ
jgi:hypothetical protein